MNRTKKNCCKASPHCGDFHIQHSTAENIDSVRRALRVPGNVSDGDTVTVKGSSIEYSYTFRIVAVEHCDVTIGRTRDKSVEALANRVTSTNPEFNAELVAGGRLLFTPKNGDNLPEAMK